MRKRLCAHLPRALLALSLLAVVPLAAAGCSRGDDTPAPPASPEEMGLMEIEIAAPDFTLPMLGGGELTLSNLQGKVVLLNFWYLDCPPCREEMPYLDAVGKAYEGTARVVALNIGDSESAVSRYFGDATIHMEVPLDFDGRVAADYRIGFTPTTFLIDSQGIARYVKIGPFENYGEIAAAIEFTLMKENE